MSSTQKLDGRPNTYYGRDQQVHTYTAIDYSPKTSLDTYIPTGEDHTKELANFLEQKIKVILSLPAICAAKDAPHLIKRTDHIVWDEEKLRATADFTSLTSLFTLLWKRIVVPEHWFDIMSDEDIINGEWRKFKVSDIQNSFT